MLAAVSGGSDSVGLAWILKDLSDRGVIALAAIGHVHHQLRGADADADEAFCRDLAARIGVPFLAGRADVRATMDAGGGSVESVARHLRYECLEAAAQAAGASHIATGHTLDDQAETVLLRLLRGAGGRGLSGIRPVRGVVIRPLIDCRRADIAAYLTSIGETFRDDVTNGDLTVPRNRVRHELLPVIERMAPGGVGALARAAALAADDEDFLSKAAIDTAHSHVLLKDGGLNVDLLNAFPPAIARRVVREAIESAAPESAGHITAAHIEAVRKLAASGESGHLDLSGVAAECDGRLLRFKAPGALVHAPAFAYELKLPGRVAVPEAKFVIAAERRDQSAPHGVETNTDRATLEVSVDLSVFAWPFSVRNRRPGDRIKPVGGLGRKKVQDLLVDMKIPRADRDHVAVVVDGNGQLVWVVGVTPADECRARSTSSGNRAEMVVLRAERQ